MRHLPLVLLLVGCPSSTSFSSQPPDVDVVEGDALLSFSPAELVWTDLEVGLSHSQELVLSSVGDRNLDVFEVRVTGSGGGVFYSEQLEDRLLAPGNSLSVLVVATLQSAKVAEGTLRVKTSDPDHLEVEVPLHASPAGAGGDSGTGDSGTGDSGTGDSGTGDSGTGGP